MIEVILAAGIVAALFCYSQLRYHEGMIDGLAAAEKMYRESMKQSKQVAKP